MDVSNLLCKGLDLMPQLLGMENFYRLAHSHNFMLKFIFGPKGVLIYGIGLRRLYRCLGVVQRKMIKIVPLRGGLYDPIDASAG